MRLCNGSKFNRPELARQPLILNGILVALGLFIVISMCVVWGVFEEFTAFTDYTQSWIEFNFFIHYWDKLTITRVYLSFIHAYGAILIAISSFQIYGLRKRNINILYLAPYLLLFVAIISILGAIAWLITTAVNHNEGFLATGGFIFERMRFKGNVWKDLKFREQSFNVVTENIVPRKAPILKTWIYQRQRDFECCGWNSYMDYAKGNYTILPESCCKREYRVFGCGANYLNNDKRNTLNTRGCGPLMYSWYKMGFAMNIVMAIIGLLISAFEFFTYSENRKEYFRLLYAIDDMAKPMMNTVSMSSMHSKASTPLGFPYGGSIRSGQTPNSAMRNGLLQINKNINEFPNLLPKLNTSYSNNSSTYGYNKAPIYEQPSISLKT